MNFKKIIIVMFVLNLLCLISNASDYNYNPLNKPRKNLQGFALFVPAGISVSAILSQEINSKYAIVGQKVSSILFEDFIYEGYKIVPAGSILSGTITQNQNTAFENKNAKMQIRFTTITTPYNNVIPISAIIATEDMTGVLKGEETKNKGEILIPSNTKIDIYFDQPITYGAQ